MREATFPGRKTFSEEQISEAITAALTEFNGTLEEEPEKRVLLSTELWNSAHRITPGVIPTHALAHHQTVLLVAPVSINEITSCSSFA
jgi:hypothetical protein